MLTPDGGDNAKRKTLIAEISKFLRNKKTPLKSVFKALDVNSVLIFIRYLCAFRAALCFLLQNYANKNNKRLPVLIFLISALCADALLVQSDAAERAAVNGFVCLILLRGGVYTAGKG